ncbi:MAG TPA: ATPase, T2SS/T4P/T4SS family [Phycisphaerales bacterium]|nr:ATPase, T2SS/T4P/T4SS family [Phycisphaerales bacterium]
MHEYLLADQSVVAWLVSWWKALLMMPPFVVWAWVMSVKIDKETVYYHFNQHMWNAIGLAASVVALAAMLFIPIFWIGWPMGMLILAAPIAAYWQYRNSRVPESDRWRLTGEGLQQKLQARKLAKAAANSVLTFSNKKGPRPVPLKEDPLFPVHMAVEDILAPALKSHASRVEVALGPSGATVWQTIDGIRYKREPLTADQGSAVLDYLKSIGGMDLKDRRRRQTGKGSVRGPQGDSEMDLVSSGSSAGVVLRVDFDRSKRLHKPIDGLGMLAQQLEAIRPLKEAHERHGIVLIGAAPGQGLTTTAYAMISRHDAYTANVKTLEREIVVDLDGVDQVLFDPSNPAVDFATNLQSMLRRDPDVVLIAEMTDAETAKVAADPGMQGPLIYVQQPLPTITDQIKDWFKRVGDAKNAAGALRVVCNQRLLRVLCPNCKQQYQPTPDQLKKMNIPATKQVTLHRASGKIQVKNKIEDCPVCNGTGYFGQTGVFEVLVLDEDMRKMLAATDLKGVLAEARRKKMIYLQEAALAKVIAGETTIEEVIRVTAPPKSSEGGAASGPKAA